MKRAYYPTLAPMMALLATLTFAAVSSFAQRPSLELQDMKQSATQAEIKLSGAVKNISPSDVSGVTVYCDFQGAGGKIVKTEQTQLDKDPLKVGGVANFACSTKTSPEIKGYNLRFDRMFGGPLVVKPAAPKK